MSNPFNKTSLAVPDNTLTPAIHAWCTAELAKLPAEPLPEPAVDSTSRRFKSLLDTHEALIAQSKKSKSLSASSEDPLPDEKAQWDVLTQGYNQSKRTILSEMQKICEAYPLATKEQWQKQLEQPVNIPPSSTLLQALSLYFPSFSLDAQETTLQDKETAAPKTLITTIEQTHFSNLPETPLRPNTTMSAPHALLAAEMRQHIILPHFLEKIHQYIVTRIQNKATLQVTAFPAFSENTDLYLNPLFSENAFQKIQSSIEAIIQENPTPIPREEALADRLQLGQHQFHEKATLSISREQSITYQNFAAVWENLLRIERIEKEMAQSPLPSKIRNRMEQILAFFKTGSSAGLKLARIWGNTIDHKIQIQKITETIIMPAWEKLSEHCFEQYTAEKNNIDQYGPAAFMYAEPELLKPHIQHIDAAIARCQDTLRTLRDTSPEGMWGLKRAHEGSLLGFFSHTPHRVSKQTLLPLLQSQLTQLLREKNALEIQHHTEQLQHTTSQLQKISLYKRTVLLSTLSQYETQSDISWMDGSYSETVRALFLELPTIFALCKPSESFPEYALNEKELEEYSTPKEISEKLKAGERKYSRNDTLIMQKQIRTVLNAAIGTHSEHISISQICEYFRARIAKEIGEELYNPEEGFIKALETQVREHQAALDRLTTEPPKLLASSPNPPSLDSIQRATFIAQIQRLRQDMGAAQQELHPLAESWLMELPAGQLAEILADHKNKERIYRFQRIQSPWFSRAEKVKKLLDNYNDIDIFLSNGTDPLPSAIDDAAIIIEQTKQDADYTIRFYQKGQQRGEYSVPAKPKDTGSADNTRMLRSQIAHFVRKTHWTPEKSLQSIHAQKGIWPHRITRSDIRSLVHATAEALANPLSSSSSYARTFGSRYTEVRKPPSWGMGLTAKREGPCMHLEPAPDQPIMVRVLQPQHYLALQGFIRGLIQASHKTCYTLQLPHEGHEEPVRAEITPNLTGERPPFFCTFFNAQGEKINDPDTCLQYAVRVLGALQKEYHRQNASQLLVRYIPPVCSFKAYKEWAETHKADSTEKSISDNSRKPSR